MLPYNNKIYSVPLRWDVFTFALLSGFPYLWRAYRLYKAPTCSSSTKTTSELNCNLYHTHRGCQQPGSKSQFKFWEGIWYFLICHTSVWKVLDRSFWILNFLYVKMAGCWRSIFCVEIRWYQISLSSWKVAELYIRIEEAEIFPGSHQDGQD